MVAVAEDLWPRCPWHQVDLEWDPAQNGAEFFCPALLCDYTLSDGSNDV